MEGPGRLRPSQRVGHDLATKQHTAMAVLANT